MSLEKVIKYDCSTGETTEAMEEMELTAYTEPVPQPTLEQRLTELQQLVADLAALQLGV